MTYNKLFKILLVGDSGVGKSSLVNRFVDDIFHNGYYSTIGVDFKMKTIQIGDITVKLQIWDTAGQERFKSLTSSYYRGAHGIIICYDSTDLESYSNVIKWNNETDKYASEGIFKLLVETKRDKVKSRCVNENDARELASNLGMKFISTSAKDSTNVEDAFKKMAQAIYEQNGGDDYPLIAGITDNRIRGIPIDRDKKCKC